jgi:hypothetical protein
MKVVFYRPCGLHLPNPSLLETGATITAMTTTTKNQNLIQEASTLVLVTALCGTGGALTTTTASAAIVSTPGISPATPLTVPANIDGVYINAVTGATGTSGAGTAGWDINPYNTTGTFQLQFFSPANPAGGALLRFPGSAITTAGSLAPGTLVDAAGVYSNITGAVTFGSAPGNWTLNSPNYFGFRFLNEGNGQVHFGFGRMDVGADASIRAVAELYYEDQPGIGIAVIPEPTGALLAAGAAGLLTLRRRRAAA